MPHPQHIAIIMDGNRRWAVSEGKPKIFGHTEGAKNMKTIVHAAIDSGLSFLTLWALSTENLKNRSELELTHLFGLMKKLPNQLKEFTDNNVKIEFLGEMTALPEDVQAVFKQMKEDTAENTGLTLNLAINYGGRDELTRTVKAIIASGVSAAEVTEELITAQLDTKKMPEVDMVIRTGGHKRLSGYLPWQSVYAELYFTDVYWPAFSADEFKKSIEWFEEQQRNRGK